MELVKARRTIEDLNNSLYSAVTFHEMYKIAAQNALDEVGARKRRAAAGKALAARQRSQAKKTIWNESLNKSYRYLSSIIQSCSVRSFE